jgi:hypothetical protein
VMASSVDRRIEGDLSRTVGHDDPVSLIRPRSTEPIAACGRVPRQQAGHMTASGLRFHTRNSPCEPGAIHIRPRAARRADPGDRRDFPEARRALPAWRAKWSGKYSKLIGWVEENIDKTLTFYRLPRHGGAVSFPKAVVSLSRGRSWIIVTAYADSTEAVM